MTGKTLPDPTKKISNRPDPLFKLVFREEALAVGLNLVETEFQYSTRADTVLIAPPSVDRTNTMFDFFRRDNIVEFKSEKDKFDLQEYARNALRTYYQFLQSNDKDFKNILNVIISSKLPRAFIKVAAERDIIFEQTENRPWLWRGEDGFQDVVIVVCRDLPIEPLYYPWLLFAPARSRTWKAFVTQLLRENNQTFLEKIENFKPKELEMITKSWDEMVASGIAAGVIPPDFQEQYDQLPEEEEDIADIAEFYLEDVAQYAPAKLGKVLSKLSIEERLGGLSPEERLGGLSPEERLGGLSPEERRKLLDLLAKEQESKN